MDSYTIKNLSFSYPEVERAVLKNLSFSIRQGEFVTLVGPSGCGKTTFLRQLKTVLAPHGDKRGKILFEGTRLSELDQRAQSSKIGFVMQSPENQIVTDKVWHELAFGLESLGFDTPSIRLRVAEMASFFGIQEWFYKNVTELSGGQKQLLNLASIMVMQPSVLILDEPTGQLDPIAAGEFLTTLGKINRELGTTIIITEHRLEEVFPLSDRVLVLDEGKLICDGTPEDVGKLLKEMEHGMFLAMPTPMRIYAGVENDLPCPVTVREGRSWLDDFSATHPLGEIPAIEENTYENRGIPAVELNEVWFRYEKELEDVLKGLSLKVNYGEFYAILGGNATGKTTALSMVSGINKPYRGKVMINSQDISKIENKQIYQGVLGVLPQNPQSIFARKTVEEELYEMFSHKGQDKKDREKKVKEIAKLCRLEELLFRHPYDLSGGEQQRAALAKVLLSEPKILLLDEPTKGLDGEFKREFAQILYNLLRKGVAIIMVSHDIEFCAVYAHSCAMFFDGNIVSRDTPRQFFSGNNFYTTAANRMARHKLSQAVTPEDVIVACGGDGEPFKIKEPEDYNIDDDNQEESDVDDRGGKGGKIALWYKNNDTIANEQTERDKRQLSKRTKAAMFMILMVIPLTIYTGIYYLGDRKYYFISMLIILETMLPFVMIFESRKPQARELIVIAVLCAIAVAGRSAFFMLPHFKPVAAIVIIAGVAFGGEAGFLVGAVTGFVSNMFFGQGPWTPWQMFAFGIIGFLAGVLFRKGYLRRNTIALCIFGGFAAFFIYGGIMNPAAVLMYQAKPGIEMFILAYLRGIPVDLVHATATVVFLYFIAKPMLEKLDRIKTKYGLID